MSTFNYFKECLERAELETRRVFDLLTILGRNPEPPIVSTLDNALSIVIDFDHFGDAYKECLATLLTSLNLESQFMLSNEDANLYFSFDE